jgi:hypothetical protein
MKMVSPLRSGYGLLRVSRFCGELMNTPLVLVSSIKNPPFVNEIRAWCPEMYSSGNIQSLSASRPMVPPDVNVLRAAAPMRAAFSPMTSSVKGIKQPSTSTR